MLLLWLVHPFVEVRVGLLWTNLTKKNRREKTKIGSLSTRRENRSRRNWGDEVDELTNGETLPATTKSTDSNGIVTIVEWRWADMEQHQKIKVSLLLRDLI